MYSDTLFRLVLLLGLYCTSALALGCASLDWIEVTQTIQDQGNNVPLVAGKKTLVRAYLSLPGLNSLQLTEKGKLLVQLPGGQSIIIHSINMPALTNGSQTGPKRQTLDDTLNFVLDSPTAGTYTLTIEDSLTGGPLSLKILCPMCGSYKVQPVFHESPHLRIKLIPVQYYDPVNFTYSNDIPTPNDFKYIQSWIKRAFPVGNSNLEVTEWAPPPEVSEELVESDTFLIDETPWTTNGTPYKSIKCDSTNYKLLQMRERYIQLHQNDTVFPFTHLHGLLADRSQGGTVDAFKRGCTDRMDLQMSSVQNFSRPGSSPTGQTPQSELLGTDSWDSDQHYGDWYTAHEIGHALGLHHLRSDEVTPVCDPNIEDPKPPAYHNGYLSAPAPYPEYFGYDAGDSTFTPLPERILHGTQWHDLMTYCNYKWISNDSYRLIWCRLYEENGTSCPPPGGDKAPMPPANLRISQSQMLSTSHLFFKERVGATDRWDFALPGFNSEPNFGSRNNGFVFLLPQHSRVEEIIGGETLRHKKKERPYEKAQFDDRVLLVDHTLAPHTAKRYLRVEASVNLANNTGRIVSTMLTTSPSAKVGTDDERAKIRLLDARNQPLSTVPVTAPTGKPILSTTGQTDWVLIEMEFDMQTKAVELVVGGQPVARREVTTTAPTVENIRVRQVGGGLIPKGMVVFEWDSADADGGDRSYIVDLSRDQGSTWRTIIVNLTKPMLALPLKRFAGISTVVLKVTASDGFNTTTVNSSQLAIPTTGGRVPSP